MVTLRALRRLDQRRVEITNPTNQPITFTLGFNDQLFENKQVLLQSIRDAHSPECLQMDPDLRLPCEAFVKVAKTLFHFPELTDQWGTTGWAPARWWAQSPMLAFNSFGFGTCGTMADVVAKLWHQLGYETRRRELNGHTVTEVFAGGRWRLFDADTAGYFADAHGPAGLDDFFSNAELVALQNSRRVGPLVRPRDFPHAGLEYYAQLVADANQSRGVSATPVGTDDWRELTFTIPPGGRLRFPERAGHDCLYPTHVDYIDYNDLTHDLTTPAHAYAVLDVPRGSAVDITNGLFPMQITGSYCVNAVYPSGPLPTERYDQIARFQYARRFARLFAPLETQSPATVYYMLTANVAIKHANQLRLHGSGVDQLTVALAQVEDSYEPPDPAEPCAQASPDLRVEVQRVSASSAVSWMGASNLIDGQLSTGWASDTAGNEQPEVLTLDLGAPEAVHGVRWSPHVALGMLSPSCLVIETSLNGSDYQEMLSVDDYRPQQVQWMTKYFEPTIARYVRLRVTPQPHFSLPGMYQATLGEIEVLGPQ